MEIQLKDNENPSHLNPLLQDSIKQYAFDNDIAAIHTFVKGLRDAPIIASKIY